MEHWPRRRRLALAALLIGFLPTLGAKGAATAVRSLPAIRSRAEFDTLARVTETPYPLPHLLFVIDRREKNRIYYVNSKRYLFHRDFVNSAYLSLERGQEFFANNFLKPNRRFILGTIAYRARLKRWTFEFWEGDLIPAEQIKLAADVINRTFFQRVAFKPNSLRQEEASAAIPGLERVLERDLNEDQDYQPLNLAASIGRVHILPQVDDPAAIGPNDILVLTEVPVSLPPVAGIVTGRPSTPLSHINLLAKSWGVPNAYIRNAPEVFKQYDGRWVSFVTKGTIYEIRAAEQILYNPETNAVRVLTRSAEDSLLQFDARGGVREVPISGERAVLTGELARRLAHGAIRIKRVFGGKDQDIEWAVRGGKVYIVQSRPYLAGG